MNGQVDLDLILSDSGRSADSIKDNIPEVKQTFSRTFGKTLE